VVGLLGSIASVLGVVLAIFFYRETTHSRDLTYLVHPVRSIVVQQGVTSELSVFLRETRIQEDVTALQVAFWNAGQEPIRAEHMLSPFVIETENSRPILEAKVRRESREIVGIELDNTKVNKGKVIVFWEILERGDGGVIQLILSGGVDVAVSASAIIEGQPEVAPVRFQGNIISPMKQYETSLSRVGRRVSLAMVLSAAVIFAVSLALIRQMRARPLKLRLVGRPTSDDDATTSDADALEGKKWTFKIERTPVLHLSLAFTTAIMSLILVLVGIYMVYQSRRQPPFGF
jgi:hypothetical protein